MQFWHLLFLHMAPIKQMENEKMKSNIEKSLEQLNKKDIYSLLLYVLYKLKDNPQYSTLSELIYILDNDSFANFLSYYGGQTITVPTMEEMQDVLTAFLFYEKKLNTDFSDDQIFNSLNIPRRKKDKIKSLYIDIVRILSEYDFKK